MSKRKKEIGFHERLLRLKRAGMQSHLSRQIWQKGSNEWLENRALSLDKKVVKLIQWLQQFKTEKKEEMLYFIMYDIRDDKVRNHIAKYLIKKGCLRVQKSVYLTKSSIKIYKSITQILREVNEVYDNEDSIMVLPVSEDKLHAMHIIGKNVDYELVTRERNVIII